MNDRHARHRRADADRRRRPSDGHRSGSRARFERLVDDALAGLPSSLRTHLEGVALVVKEVPDPARDPERLLGRYDAAPSSPRVESPVTDRLTLFRRPLEARARSKPDLIDLVRDTVVQEVADHLGIDDDGIDELGWR